MRLPRSRPRRTRLIVALVAAALAAALLAPATAGAALSDEYEPGPCITNAVVPTPFVDVPSGQFYTNAVGWAYLNDVTRGTDDTHFSPEFTVTRAQFATYLHRMMCLPAAAVDANAIFGDLEAGAYYDTAVDWLFGEGITKGTTATTFGPHDGLTRGQFATLLYRLVGEPGGAPESGFTDVPPWRLDAAAIDWLLWRGITTGTSDTTFHPDRVVKRSEAVTFLYRLNIFSAGLVDPSEINLGFSTVATGLSSPVDGVAHPIDGSMYIVEQAGHLLRVPANGDGTPNWGAGATEILDIESSVFGGGERGLLGVAISPDGSHLYLSFTRTRAGTTIDCDGESVSVDNDSVIWEYALVNGLPSGGPAEIIRVAQHADNHNGGQMAFGPDGYLYATFGDGGGVGDPCEVGQDTDRLLGSIIRIAPDGVGGYSIPASNPYVGGGGRPEIYLIGVRNPWKFSFDMSTGDLWVADVGQSTREEITRLLASEGTGLGANLGWNTYEGTTRFDGADPDISDHVGPIYEYSTGGSEGRSITGGFVYRGSEIIGLNGTYIWADFINPELRGFNDEMSSGAISYGVDATGGLVASFLQDGTGEVYSISHNGTIAQIVDLG